MKKLILLIPVILFACGSNEESKEASSESNTESSTSMGTEQGKVVVNSYKIGEDLDIEALQDNIDLEMDISDLGLAEIRILRNAFAAQQGYCFMKADLRGIFSTTSWYGKKMEERYWAEEEGSTVDPISYTKEEQAFIAKLKKQENKLKAQNYTH